MKKEGFQASTDKVFDDRQFVHYMFMAVILSLTTILFLSIFANNSVTFRKLPTNQIRLLVVHLLT